MRGGRVMVAVALASVTALAGCDETTAGPTEQAASAAFSVEGEGIGVDGPQRRATPPGPGRVLALADELDLTAEQSAAIEEIDEELREENEPLLAELRERRGDDGGPPQERPAFGNPTDDPIVQALRENTREAMEEALALLTDEQRSLFRELRRERSRERRPGGFDPPGGFEPGAHILGLAEELGLTETQVARLEAIFAELRAENEPLLEELREGGEPGAGLGSRSRWNADDPLVAELRENLRDAMEEVREVLTAEQWEILRTHREERGGPPGRHRPE